MKKIIYATLVTGLLSASLVSNTMAGPSENTGMGSKLSAESVLLSGPFSIVFLPVMASGITASAVSDSLILLGSIGDAISITKVERQEKTTVVYGKATEKTTQKQVDVKFAVPNQVANKAQMQAGKDIKLQQTPMGTLVTYENQSLGFAAGTEQKNNMKSVQIK